MVLTSMMNVRTDKDADPGGADGYNERACDHRCGSR